MPGHRKRVFNRREAKKKEGCNNKTLQSFFCVLQMK